MEFIKKYFYKKQLEQNVEELIKYHLQRIKKTYLKKVNIIITKEVFREDVSVFITNEEKRTIVFQLKILSRLANGYMLNFLTDNITEAIRHEFSHLKYGNEKNAQKHEKKIDIFKKQ